MSPRIHIKGPTPFLRAVVEAAAGARADQGDYWMGILEFGGAGSPRFPHVDIVHLDIREGVTRDDAIAICNLGLDRIAETQDMKAERAKATLTFENEGGRDHEV